MKENKLDILSVDQIIDIVENMLINAKAVDDVHARAGYMTSIADFIYDNCGLE